MCLAAIYWARIAKVFYARTRHDAAAIGFDDHFIYEQLSLDAAARSLPMEQMASENSAKLFREWLAKPDRVNY
jgi:tRNA(Arg) A34 adenosine deaminase TadA